MFSACSNCQLLTAESLERVVRDSCVAQDYDKIAKIVDQLCHEYAYAVHQPHARNGGLIGLAAAAIAMGSVRRGASAIDYGFGLTG